MKKPRLHTCKAKGCGTKYEKKRLGQVCCSPRCAIRYAVERREKRERDDAARDRRETKAKLEAMKPRSHWVKLAKKAFHSFVRYRDQGNGCISCGALLIFTGKSGGDYDAGHYRSVGSAKHLEFDERNVHGQCKRCNNQLSGNAVDYRIGLVRRIGIAAVHALESDCTARHYSIDDLKALASQYKAKLKELKTMDLCNGV